jgi:hydrogenase nickel incorporation protein HypA/HybF
MHEMSIVRHILDAVKEFKDENGKPPVIVKVQIGEFSHVSERALDFAWLNSRVLYQMDDTKLDIIRVSAELRCRECNTLFTPKTYELKCVCGSGNVEVTKGQEMILDSVIFANDISERNTNG